MSLADLLRDIRYSLPNGRVVEVASRGIGSVYIGLIDYETGIELVVTKVWFCRVARAV